MPRAAMTHLQAVTFRLTLTPPTLNDSFSPKLSSFLSTWSLIMSDMLWGFNNTTLRLNYQQVRDRQCVDELQLQPKDTRKDAVTLDCLNLKWVNGP